MRQGLIAGAAALALGWAPAGAQDARYALGAGVGTTGVEAQAAYGVSDWLSLRVSGNFLDYDEGLELELDSIEYETTLEASTFAAFFDARPFANAFTVTGGVYLGTREVSLASTPIEDVEIGGTTFTPDEVGTLAGGLDLGEVAPYLGLGLDNTFTGRSRVGLRLGAGVLLGGEPDVALGSMGGSLSLDPAFQAALSAEAERIADDADLLRYYPVLSAGLFVKF